MRPMPGAVKGLACLLCLWLLAPFVAGMVRLGDADWAGVDRAGLARAAGVSMASAGVATLLIGLFGIPLGYVLARGRGWWTVWLGGVVQLPLALPPLAGGVLLLFLLGYGGPLGGLGLSEHFAGIVAAEMFVAAPFLIIAARSAFAAVDLGRAGYGVAAGLWRIRRDGDARLSSLLPAGLYLCRVRRGGIAGHVAGSGADPAAGRAGNGGGALADATRRPWCRAPHGHVAASGRAGGGGGTTAPSGAGDPP
ncbi:ABC transporter permease [Gluconacetobacter dulcium]|uniref:hypothetical protein n=1 Tax=Gluconacetobacter dulcium TaxID=2729096 RepID=UPI001FEA658C|nr:hypothetical protein [Gluconacetobacter dulcium]